MNGVPAIPLIPASGRTFRKLLRTACGLLPGVAMTCVLPGCLQSNPPDYQSLAQTPPMLDLNSADPSLLNVLDVDTTSGETIPFNIKVQSEDRGVGLIAVLYVDYGVAHVQQTETVATVPASTFSDTSRQISLNWTVPSGPVLSPGCHQLTLLVTHATNLPIRNSADVGLATWWLNVDDQPAGTNTLAGCPTTTGGGSK